MGDTSISTGGATSTANIINSGNTNTSATPGTGGTGASVVNDGNGAYSTNNSSATVSDTNNANQVNSASIDNNLTQNTTTGENSASFNNGDSSISTGDANTTGTVINSVNTNVDGVAVAEFNIIDDHVGDIVLNYGENCISGCGTGSVSAVNSGNGAGSLNTADVDATNSDTANQTNDANIGNTLDLSADSGNNKTILNTNGDSSITTGDANVEANVLTFANNNLAGNVVLGVVNIFGDLVGNIILTEEALNSFCGNCLGSVSTSNSDNGAYSQNDANATVTNTNDTQQFNNADITNNLTLDANTGDNDASLNTGGNSSVQSGTADVSANVLNIGNLNLSGGNYWLVLINDAGRWIGKILGTEDGSTIASSDALEFNVDSSGEVSVTNAGNGVGSTNTAYATTSQNTSVNQNNDAHIVNNVNLSANTGGNRASYNTGGDSSITTGDANIIANIVNFVNNNIVGGGNLFVNIVNVFGSWIGDFVTPGYTPQNSAIASNETHSENSHTQESSNNDSSNSNSVSNPTASRESTNDLIEPILTPALKKVSKVLASASLGFETGDGNGNETAFAGSSIDSTNQVNSKKVYDFC
ncbi:MAG: hypothetical protein UT61_C0042G0010 [Candidatus Woesebacteria bacterium GW2011_GWA1_39_8]|uniref:Uncharacterized protein n=1 Tax=Candidatus Woesebacteria bacterium GW2011_GWA1_39_8 TaxID=1618552 RepID=A0A0G0S266_9BACT|nr:MAG: hypothetical protein UT61_C0042G0010 [Candidatus Woesebacteria bacterium GW2011_GWA1_39_8]